VIVENYPPSSIIVFEKKFNLGLTLGEISAPEGTQSGETSNREYTVS